MNVLDLGGRDMAARVTIEGAERVPGESVLVIPNRVDEEVVRVLEERLGGMHKITWLVQEELRPAAEVLQQVGRDGAHGMMFSPRRLDAETLHEQIRVRLESGRHVVLLPGRPVQAPAHYADVPPRTLNYLLGGYKRQVLPVFVGLYGGGGAPVGGAPYEEAQVSFLPVFSAAANSAARVADAWSFTSTEQVTASMEKCGGILSKVLLDSLQEHPDAQVIDGVDEQGLNYRRLLMLAMLLVRRLRKSTTLRRMGIILPPGRFSVIANVACILAGITPVNIDYNYTQQEFSAVAQQAELTLYITGRRFRQKQRHFPWPPERDLLFIEEMLEPAGNIVVHLWERMTNRVGRHRSAAWLGDTREGAEAEALTVFRIPEEGDEVRGVRLSHRAVLAGYRLTAARLGLQPGQRVLSSLPFYHRAGLFLGLIYPLLSGQDIITYPEPETAKRLCTLVRKYQPNMMPLDARQLPGILAHAQERDFGGTKHILVTGRLTEAMAQRAYRERGLCLCSCYLPAELAMPVACSVRPEGGGASAWTVPCGDVGSVGMVMPGVAVKVRNGEKDAARGEQGHLWVKGAALFSGCAGKDVPPEEGLPRRWVDTGDIASIREDGLLCVGGPQERFSRIEGEYVSHAQAEEVLGSLLGADAASETPQLAVVGAPTSDGRGEQLVLLSTLHQSVGPHDVITTRYSIANARYSTKLAPQRILAVRAIPTLRGGGVDYDLCRRYVLKVVTSERR